MSNWSAIKDRNNKVKENKTTRNNSCDKDHIQSSTHRDSTTNESGYEELFQSIPCPSCRGLGRIPRESESQLVALIPLSDDRLKPSRTKLYVTLAVMICLTIGGMLLFFLYPRTITIISNMPILTPSYIYVNETEHVLFMSITNRFNITNENFITIHTTDLEMTATINQQSISTSSNKTSLTVPLRSTRQHYLDMNITLTDDTMMYIVLYCSEQSKHRHQILIPFQVTLTTKSLGHSEQTSLTTYQQVICSEPIPRRTLPPATIAV